MENRELEESKTERVQWREVQGLLLKNIGEWSFNRFFKNAEILTCQFGLCRLRVAYKTKFWIEEHFSEQFCQVICQVFSWDSCNLEIEEEDSLLEEKKSSSDLELNISPKNSLKKLKNSGLSEFYLDQFETCESNHLAFEAVKNALNFDSSFLVPPLFLYGPSGCGKTHLLQGAGRFLLEKQFVVKYISAENFVNDYVSAVLNKKGLHSFRETYRNLDCLLVDDFQFFNGDKSQLEFLHTLESFMRRSARIIISADCSFLSIGKLNADLKKKFEKCSLLKIEHPPLEISKRIMKEKMGKYNIDLNDEVLEFISHHLINLSQVDGIFYKVATFVSMMDNSEDFTLKNANDLLGDSLMQEKESLSRAKLSIGIIQSKVSEFFGIPKHELVGLKRTQGIVLARQTAMYLMRNLTDSSLIEIATAFSRDHATVLHACKSIEKKKAQREDFASRLNVLKKDILYS